MGVTKEELEDPGFLKTYQETIKKGQDGRLTNMLKKMTKEERTEYHKMFDQYEDDGYIGEADTSYNGVCNYLPYSPVIKTDAKTTNIRPVFDGSAHQQNKPILLRFRQSKIEWTEDIAQAFLQIAIQQEHEQLIRFLWVDNPNEEPVTIKEYRWKQVPFGLSCSPFILRELILKCMEEHQKVFPELTKRSEDQLYVDDWLGGADCISQALILIDQARKLFQSAKMELRKWTTNHEELRNSLENVLQFQNDIIGMARNSDASIKALGVTWNPTTDTLQFNPDKVVEDAKELNKRPT
ncbi:uncharacterized protein LOC116928669 [Daphnia magna]|uniref:uncharacterized protein LOC116928669 n=1 Tax=Daphnia magna TaxID=35525 RepID=UPI001E1BCDDD|nr:uncharacterized protein LOC116928669 [Daphnia magna]